VLLVACQSGGSSASTSTTRRPTSTTEAPSSTASTASSQPGAAALATPVRVQLIGDSITQGEFYRPVLRQLLADASCDVVFVGSKQEVLASGLEADHSGYGGWTADQIADAVEEWTSQAKPQVVTLQAGTNDFYRGHDVATTVEDFRRIITTIRKVNPEVRIVLNTTIPGVGIEDQTTELNTGLLRLVDELRQPASPIVVVDQAFGFNWPTDTYDEVHPTPPASERMAKRLLDGLKPVLSTACKAP
jgi:lysophospholipase L1-like esterase